MSICYRDAAAADAPVVEKLFRESFIDTFGHLYSEADLQAFLSKFTVGAWAGELSDPALAIRIAEHEKEPAGFAKIGPLSVPFETGAKALELRQLYILPQWKGIGVAAALIEWALEEMKGRGAEEVLLSVYADNHRAKRFYGRYAFEEVGAYHFMVGNQADDERIMRLKLEGSLGG